ncbi:MAG: aromatic ring-opening dioxygenase LigA [Candidatus Nanopelagicales bacterium]
MRTPRIIALLLYVAGAILMVAGIGTWVMVSNELGQENIVVSDDASCQAGQKVNGPLEAFCQAEIIREHALAAGGGKTFAELDRDDPARATAMNGSFLRASLFTSVVSFGVAAFAIGMGIITLLIAAAIQALTGRLTQTEVQPESAGAVS